MLSIRPEYAVPIFQRNKRFEFRRTLFKRHVDGVVVYVTAPVGGVVGEFRIGRIISDDINSLWTRTKEYAGISFQKFRDYFAGRDVGHAIEIASVQKYPQMLDLDAHFGLRPPQSFVYLDFPWTRPSV